MPAPGSDLVIRPVNELDIGAIVKIDEKITGRYRPDDWERRIGYYIRRDPDASLVAESQNRVVGFMLGEVRAGDFGLDEPTGWVEVLGVDPAEHGRAIGRRLAEAMFDYFKRRGARTARTLVDDSMPEVGRFFEALGFELAGMRPYRKVL